MADTKMMKGKTGISGSDQHENLIEASEKIDVFMVGKVAKSGLNENGTKSKTRDIGD